VAIDIPDSVEPDAPGSPQLELEDQRATTEHRLIVRGELDMASAPMLVSRLHRLFDEPLERLVLDLSELTFMDSNGLRTVLLAKELCDQHGCEFLLVPGPPQIQRLFEVTGMLGRLPFRARPH
jgi:stage II sporulation protein AA (anti-sigma F factor antagonist)